MDVCKVNFAAYYELAVQRKSHCRSDDLCNGKDYGENGRSFVAYFKFAVLARDQSPREHWETHSLWLRLKYQEKRIFPIALAHLVTEGGGKEIACTDRD